MDYKKLYSEITSTITEIKQTINSLHADISDIHDEVKKVSTTFRAIRHSIAERIMDEDDIDMLLLSFTDTLDRLEDMIENCESDSRKQ